MNFHVTSLELDLVGCPQSHDRSSAHVPLQLSAPRTLPRPDQARLLRTVARDGPIRDHTLLALATGLPIRELVGLYVSDVAPDGRQVGWRAALDPALTKNGRAGVAFLPPRVHRDLARHLAWKRRHGESLGPDAPLFLSNQSRRLPLRWTRINFARWQRVAGLRAHL